MSRGEGREGRGREVKRGRRSKGREGVEREGTSVEGGQDIQEVLPIVSYDISCSDFTSPFVLSLYQL